MVSIEFPIVSFENRKQLRKWLSENHSSCAGIFVRIYKIRSGVKSVTFEEVLDEGLCFGWSENKRLPHDSESYLQRFTPRRSKGTTSERNKAHARKLIDQGLMTQAGRDALGRLE